MGFKDLPTGLICLAEATATPVVLHAIFSYPSSGRNVKRIDEVVKLFSKEAMSA